MPRKQLNPRRRRKLEFAQRNADTNATVIAADGHVKAGEDGAAGRRMATIGQGGLKDPLTSVGNAITAALDPNNAPKPCKTLSTMTPEERAKMVALYGPVSSSPLLDNLCNSTMHWSRSRRPRAVKEITCPRCGKVLTSCAVCLEKKTLEERLRAHLVMGHGETDALL